MAQRTFLRTLRLALLVAVLAFVALGAWLDRERSTSWDRPLWVTIYPQKTGEIMGGRIAEGPRAAAIPGRLAQMRVGPETAREIGWLR